MEKVPTSHVEDGAEKQQEKAFLYHMVPNDMRGNVLHPLNSLKEQHPDLYTVKAGKYEGREHVMEQFIPTLEASWNDVLHFTPINPEELKQALVEAGAEPHEMKFYQVDPSLLDPKLTTIYLYQERTRKDKMSEESFTEYDPNKLHEYASLPNETKEYYKEAIKGGKRPLLFVGVPHILHKGSIDISNFPVISV